MSLPKVGIKVLTSEPMIAEVDGKRCAIFARALCDVLAHDEEGTMTLLVAEGDTMSYVSAAGGLIVGVHPAQVISRESAMASD